MLHRTSAVAALASDRFDLVVVGGGITGAGVALDAASRGYSVALVERADFASGTSSRSSKLVHGGLRYLQNFDLGLVREALLERQLMVRLAPHLVRPLPLVVPAFDGERPDRLVGMGLNMYDVMSVDRIRRRRGRKSEDDTAPWAPDRHRIISGEEVVDLGGRTMNGRAYCGRFNFKGTEQQKKVGTLSGGERNRVHLAKLLRTGGNLLLLDEPTNDLDVTTLRSLEEGLSTFGGCAIVISHDRWFLDRVATHILAFESESEVTWFEGNFDAYHEHRRKLLGDEADRPHRIKYLPFTRA